MISQSYTTVCSPFHVEPLNISSVTTHNYESSEPFTSKRAVCDLFNTSVPAKWSMQSIQQNIHMKLLETSLRETICARFARGLPTRRNTCACNAEHLKLLAFDKESATCCVVSVCRKSHFLIHKWSYITQKVPFVP